MEQRNIKAVLSSADVSTAASVPIYYNGCPNAVTVNSTDEVEINTVQLTWTGATSNPGDVHVYFSTDGSSPVSWQTIARGEHSGTDQYGHFAYSGFRMRGPPGYKIYVKADGAGEVNVVLNGSIIQR